MKADNPTHPGEILLEMYLKPMGMSVPEMARKAHVLPTIIQEVIDGRRPVKQWLAFIFAKVLNTSPELWLNLQKNYDDFQENKSAV